MWQLSITAITTPFAISHITAPKRKTNTIRNGATIAERSTKTKLPKKNVTTTTAAAITGGGSRKGATASRTIRTRTTATARLVAVPVAIPTTTPSPTRKKDAVPTIRTDRWICR